MKLQMLLKTVALTVELRSDEVGEVQVDQVWRVKLNGSIGGHFFLKPFP